MSKSDPQRLVDDLSYVAKYSDSEHWDTLAEVASELRHLHAINEELLNAVRFLLSNPDNRISVADVNAAEAVLAKVKS